MAHLKPCWLLIGILSLFFRESTIVNAKETITPSYSAFVGAIVTIPSSTYTTINFSSVFLDNVGGNAGGTYAIPNGAEGKYAVDCSAGFTASSTSGTISLFIYKNGAQAENGIGTVHSIQASVPTIESASAVLQLDIGDKVSCVIYQTLGSSVNLTFGNISLVWIGK